jgi:hypothetical protein
MRRNENYPNSIIQMRTKTLFRMIVFKVTLPFRRIYSATMHFFDICPSWAQGYDHVCARRGCY